MFALFERVFKPLCFVGGLFSFSIFLLSASAMAQETTANTDVGHGKPTSTKTVTIGKQKYTNYIYADGFNYVVRDVCATDDSMVVEVRKEEATGGYQYIYSDGSWCITQKQPTGALKKLQTNEPVYDGTFPVTETGGVKSEFIWVGNVLYVNMTFADGGNIVQQACGARGKAGKIVAIHKQTAEQSVISAKGGTYAYEYADGTYCETGVAPPAELASLMDNDAVSSEKLLYGKEGKKDNATGGQCYTNDSGEKVCPASGETAEKNASSKTTTNNPGPVTVVPPTTDSGECTNEFQYPSEVTWVNGGNRYTGDYSSGGHPGVDFACTIGQPIYAIDGGVVEKSEDIPLGQGDGSGEGLSSFGRHVIIKHCATHNGGIIKSHYAHLSTTTNASVTSPDPQRFNVVAVNASVSKGQIIGYCGSSGNSSAQHLHFGLFYDGRNEYSDASIDPAYYGIGPTN